MNVLDFTAKKQAAEKIVMITCYEYFAAKIAEQIAEVDVILVGDSVAMVVHGHHSTTLATMNMMCLHTSAVARGIRSKFIVADLPFLAYRKSLANTMDNVRRLIQAGAHAVKLEGADGNLDAIHHIVTSGIPVIGHLGMTPQSVNMLGGHKIQGKNEITATSIITQAQQLQQAGCCAIVLECIPADLAHTITQQLIIPTIGIGAGPHVDGQVLVWHDMLGMQHELNPRFLKRFANLSQHIQTGLKQYGSEVKHGFYPVMEQHTY